MVPARNDRTSSCEGFGACSDSGDALALCCLR